MSKKRFIAAQPSSHRASACWSAFAALLVLAAAPALAQPSVSVSAASLTAEVSSVAQSYDGDPAICAATDQVDVTATVTPSYFPVGTTTQTGIVESGCHSCTEFNTLTGLTCAGVFSSGASSVKYTTSVDTTYAAGSCDAKATDSHTAVFKSFSCTGSPETVSFTPSDLQTGTDGAYHVDITASVSQNRTVVTKLTRADAYANGACGGGGKGTVTTGLGQTISTVGPTALTGSEASPPQLDYFLDINAPTVVHDLVGAPVTVSQNGGVVNYNITSKLGSAGTGFDLKALASGPANLESSDGTFTFAGATSSGIAADSQQVVGLTLACNPFGTYTSDAQLLAVDLCGGSWGTIKSSDDGGFTLPTFDVTEDSVNCSNEELGVTTVVTAPLESDNYEGVECFESHKAGRGKNKTVATPGTVHVGSVVSMPAGDIEDCDNTISGLMVTLTKDAAFDWTMSGGSPATHVFWGDAGGGFFYHSGFPLTEITGDVLAVGGISGGTDNDDNDIDINLSNVDVGCGPGEFPYGGTLYARAHVRFSRTNDIGTDEEHAFSSSATSSDPVGPFMDDESIWENPDGDPHPLCDNGVFAPPACPEECAAGMAAYLAVANPGGDLVCSYDAFRASGAISYTVIPVGDNDDVLIGAGRCYAFIGLTEYVNFAFNPPTDQGGCAELFHDQLQALNPGDLCDISAP